MQVIQLEFPKGRRVGDLTVLGPAKKWHYVRCRCICGAVTVAYVSNLRLGKTTSCGSHRDGAGSIRVNVVRGDSKHPLYSLWRGMINRCYNRNQPHYARYGGRGITVCSRWLSFRKFVADMGERPPKCSLDRIDNNGSYNLQNCRWASYKEQAVHKRVAVNAQLVFCDGVALTISQWSRKLGIGKVTLQKRFDAGWQVERALKTPVGPSGPKPKF